MYNPSECIVHSIRNNRRRPLFLSMVLLGISVVITLVCSQVLLARNASAVSVYDDTLKLASSLKVESASGDVDVTSTYGSLMASGCGSSYYDSFVSAVNNGGDWVILNYDEGAGKRIRILWSPVAGSLTAQFASDSPTIRYLYLTGTLGYAQFGQYAHSNTAMCDYSTTPTWMNMVLTSANFFASNEGIYTNTFKINYPEDYTGLRTPEYRNYAALGDSFSSGEGNSPFDSGAASDCHRSNTAFPRKLNADPTQLLHLTKFVACSGATTDTLINGSSTLDPQTNALTDKTEIVTVTIGGNDVGFGEYATACTLGLCDFSTQAYDNIHNSIQNDLPAKLADAYEAIDSKTESTAKIYVVGYPHLAPAVMPTGPNSACWPLNGGINDPDPALNNGAAVRAVVDQLNSAIEEAVADFGSSKFVYVDPNGTGSPFIGHDWCNQDRYFVQVSPNITQYSYHPNANGHEAYATILKAAIE